MQSPPAAPQTPLSGCMTGQPCVPPGSPFGERAGIDLGVVEAEDAAEGALQLDSSSSASRLALVAQRPLSRMMPWAMVASGLRLSIQTKTPLFWQLVGWLAVAPKMASMTEPSAS